MQWKMTRPERIQEYKKKRSYLLYHMKQVIFVSANVRTNCPIITSVQAGAVLMPLAMFLLSLKSIRVL